MTFFVKNAFQKGRAFGVTSVTAL